MYLGASEIIPEYDVDDLGRFDVDGRWVVSQYVHTYLA